MTWAFLTTAAWLAARAAPFWRFALLGGRLDAASVHALLEWSLRPLALAAVLIAAARGLGRRTLAALGAGNGDGAGLVAFALGLALLGQIAFLLGTAGALTSAIFVPITLAAAASGGVPARRPASARGSWPAARSLAAGLLTCAALYALATALAPPTGWDVRAYHLAIPEIYAQAHGLTPTPWLLHSHWPHLMETLYTLPLSLNADGSAALLHASACAALVWGTYKAGRERAGETAGWTAALLMAAQPAFLREAGTAHADGAAALLAFAAATALARAEEDPRREASWTAAAGLLAGGAAACKLTLALPLAAWTAWRLWRRGWREAARFSGWAALMLGPWLAWQWRASGDPVWPFMAGPFHAGPAATALAWRVTASNRWSLPPPLDWLTHDGPGFLLLPLAGLTALSPDRRGASALEKALAVAGLALLAEVWRLRDGWRYLMPVWPALALAAGRAAAPALETRGPRRAAAATMIAAGIWPILAASPNNALYAVMAPRPTSAAADADRRALWEDRAVDVAAFYRDAAARLPSGARVLLFREIRGYRAGFAYMWGDPINQDLIDYRALPGPDALAARLKALGVTHVLDHPGSTLYQEDPGYYDARTLAMMAETLRRRGRLVFSQDGLALYALP